MKKLLSILVLGSVLFMSSVAETHAQANIPDYKGYLGALDTLTNAADTTTYEVSITGTKSNITFVVAADKLSGTVAGTYALYGSADGTEWVTAAIASGSITNVTTNQNFVIALTTNSYSKYKLQITNTNGSSAFSQRSYVLWRQSLNGFLMIALCSGMLIPIFRNRFNRTKIGRWFMRKFNRTDTGPFHLST